MRFDRIKTDSIVLEEKMVVVKRSYDLVLSKNSKSLGEVWCRYDPKYTGQHVLLYVVMIV